MRASLPARAFARLERLSSTALYRLVKPWDSSFKPLFICGVAGSGTTLVTALLNQRYQIAAYLPESALAADATSCLRIEPTGHYSTLAAYWQAMFFGPDITSDRVRMDSLRLYRDAVQPPKRGKTVLDKAPNTHLVRAGLLAQAFPSAYFLLIVRNPITSIEGLRRKWSLYREASLPENCDFWANVHAKFIEDSPAFAGRLTILTFDELIANPNEVIARLADLAGLNPRREWQTYQDTPNQPGKGLRNVVAGEIRIDPQADASALARLDPQEAQEIHSCLWAQYEDLRQRSTMASIA
ncbi:MAG: sulfotransferase [Anaerolineales bacterium]|nr:sulfotransferase [Anaerolineales bacterium]